MKYSYTMKILIIFIAGIFSTNLVFAEIRPYFEGQMNYIDPDDVSTDTLAGNLSGIDYLDTRIDFKHKSDTSPGFEFGLYNLFDNSNLRLGFSYTKSSINIDYETSSLSGAISKGLLLLPEGVGITREDYKAVGLNFEKNVKLYMLNAYYDFDFKNNFKPFIGVGLGLSDLDNTDDGKEFTYSGMIGARYYFNEQVYVGGKFTHFSIEGPKDKMGLNYRDIDLYTGTLSVGLEF